MMNFLRKFENWRILRARKKNPAHYLSWAHVRHLSCFKNFTASEKARLRTLTSVLLSQKRFVGVQGLILTEDMKLIIASQACVPILKLGVNFYSGFVQVTVYPTAFWTIRDVADEAGVVHREKLLLSGESWSRGPVILSWEDIEHDMQRDHEGHNVIIHEFSHKIDMQNRGANGTPPIPRSSSEEEWNEVFEHAYKNLLMRLRHHHKPSINVYAAKSRVEFFAVVSEYFFTSPEQLYEEYRQVYKELAGFYLQDPMGRLAKSHDR
jgi:MtfA peptidase